jgi:hypothetical protein
LDICPLRLIRPTEDVIEKVAAQEHLPFVDAANTLAAVSMDEIPGNDKYLDHVHPNIAGHHAIARAIVAQMQKCGLISNRAAWPEEKAHARLCRQIKQLGPRYLADGRHRVEWLENWARRQRLLEETAPRDAAGWFRDGVRWSELADDERARKAFGKALEGDSKASQMLETIAQPCEPVAGNNRQRTYRK